MIDLEFGNYALEFEAEYARAVRKHPHFPTNLTNMSGIVCEEAGESMQASVDYNMGLNSKENLAKFRNEIVQVGAMALRVLNAIDSGRVDEPSFKHVKEKLSATQSELLRLDNFKQLGSCLDEEMAAYIKETLPKT